MSGAPARLVTVPVRAAWFVLWFAWQVVRSSFDVIRDVLTPAARTTPRVVRLRTGGGDAHLTTLSILVTLTPGTLVLGVVPDDEHGRALLVHAMYEPDDEAALTALHDLDRRLRGVLTPGGHP